MTNHGKRARWPWVTGAVTAICLALGIGFFKDDALDDHSDLAVIGAPHAPGGLEAFRAWVAAAHQVNQRPAGAVDPDIEKRAAGYIPWNQDAFDHLVAQNANALAAAFAADRMGKFVVPELLRFDHEVMHTVPLMELGVLRLLAAERFQNGDAHGAAKIALMNLRFADCYIEQNTVLIDFLVANLCTTYSLDAMEWLITERTPADVLEQLEVALSQAPDLQATLDRCYRHEFRLFTSFIRDIESYEVKDILMTTSEDLPHDLLLKMNRTINLVAEQYRVAIENTRVPQSRRKKVVKRSAPKGLARWSSNAFGNYLAGNDPANIELIVAAAERTLARRRALVTKIALLRYHADEGAMPHQLSDLVPRYLDEVPLDPFDQAPLRYDPKRGAVWTIGADLKDDGGKANPSHKSFSNGHVDPTLFVFPHRGQSE